MNAKQSNTTREVNDNESNNNYPTNNPVPQTAQNGATTSGQETEIASETSSAKQRREERMKKFDIEFETKMRLEQAEKEISQTGPVGSTTFYHQNDQLLALKHPLK